MLDQTVEVTGWHAAWISRTLPAFQIYSTVVVDGLSLTVLILGILGFFGIRRHSKELKANPDNRTAILKKINARLLKTCLTHWAVANLYMVNVFIVAMVDAYIGASAIGTSVSEHPQDWTSGAMLELGAYCLYLVVVFAFTFIVVPLLQMLFITYLLARFARKRGVTTLADYIPEARMFSTHIAQIWAMGCFFIVAWWVPSEESFWRYVLLQGTIGSAVAWLDASSAFNFCADKLADEDLTLSTGGVAEIVKMFGKAAKATHTWEKKGGDVLPRYEEVAQEDAMTSYEDAVERTTKAEEV